MQPTDEELNTLAATLRRGQQRAVGGGIYARVDAQGRLRYQFRLRERGARSPNGGRTYDSWAEADAERRRRLELRGAWSGGRSRRPHDRLTIEAAKPESPDLGNNHEHIRGVWRERGHRQALAA